MNDSSPEQLSITKGNLEAPIVPQILKKLPNEIFVFIVEYLPDEDVLNLPFDFIDRGLPPETASRRFENLFVCIENKSLTTLDRISRYSTFSQCVKELTMHMATPCKPDEEQFITEQWHAHRRRLGWPKMRRPHGFNLQNLHHWEWIPLSREYVPILGPLTETDTKRCPIGECRGWPSSEAYFNALEKTFKDHQAWREGGTDLKVLTTAFQRLSKLKIITIDNVDRTEEELTKLGAAPFATGKKSGGGRYNGDYGAYFLTQLTKTLSISSSKPNTLRLIDDHGKSASRFRENLNQLPTSLAARCRPRPRFSCWGWPTPAYENDFHDSEKPQTDCKRQRYSKYIPSKHYFATFEGLVKSAISVEELAISPCVAQCSGYDFYQFGSTKHACLPLSNYLIPGLHTQLRILTLTDFHTSEQNLVDSLQACARTLIELTLGLIAISRGTWRGAFTHLNGAFKLRRLELGALSMWGAPALAETGINSDCDVLWAKHHGAMIFDILCGNKNENDSSWEWLCRTDGTDRFRFLPTPRGPPCREVPSVVGQAKKMN